MAIAGCYELPTAMTMAIATDWSQLCTVVASTCKRGVCWHRSDKQQTLNTVNIHLLRHQKLQRRWTTCVERAAIVFVTTH